MKAQTIGQGIQLLGAIDWDRRLFDSLIPLPDGTSYNAYLVQGSDKTALLDTVDPTMADVLMAQLASISTVDYVVAHHAEQDHSGTIPLVLAKYPDARVVCSPKCKGMLADHLGVAEDRVITVADGDVLPLGDRDLKFIHTPWVHWPETMVSYLPQDKILFSCDLFGSHLATSEVFADAQRVYEPAKRYYAEIMMPFRAAIQKNLEKLSLHDIRMIAPSHGPLHRRPGFVLDAYRDWVYGAPKNVAVVAYVSMHNSTRAMVEHLVGALVERGVMVERFNLPDADLGKLAEALVDAATIIIGTPTVLAGAHPSAAYAAFLANALRPKAKYASLIGSYGWGGKTVEQVAGLLSNLKVEMLPPVLARGLPKQADFKAIDGLADTIAAKHSALAEAAVAETAQ